MFFPPKVSKKALLWESRVLDSNSVAACNWMSGSKLVPHSGSQFLQLQKEDGPRDDLQGPALLYKRTLSPRKRL